MTAVNLTYPLSSGFDYDERKRGAQLVLDSKECEVEFTPEIAGFHKRGEGAIDGQEMMRRAAGLGDCAGQRHAEAMLEKGPAIPKEWERFVLVFPGTIWGRYGVRKVPVLYCDTGCDCRWYLVFRRLVNNRFERNCRIVRLVK